MFYLDFYGEGVTDLNEVGIEGLSTEKFVDSILYKLQEEYDYPSYHVKWYLKRKNTLLLCLEGELYTWEKELVSQGKNINVFMHAKKYFDNIFRRLFIPALQEKYCSLIDHIYLTKRNVKKNKRKGYVIILFRDAIFLREPSIASHGVEDQLSNRMAKAIRNLTGKGPKIIKTVLLDEQTVVHSINGIITTYEQKAMTNTSLLSLGCNGLALDNVNEILPKATSHEMFEQHLFIRNDLFINDIIINSIRESLLLCYDYVKKDDLHIFIEIDVIRNQCCVLVIGCKLDQCPQSI